MIRLRFGFQIALTLGLCVANVQGADDPSGPSEDRVGFPTDYAINFEVLRSVHRADSHEIVTVFGNALAASVKSPEQLPYPQGSVLVMETSKVSDPTLKEPPRDSQGRFQRGDVVKLHVMRRGEGFGVAYGENRSGDWEFAEYKADGSYLTHPRASATCAQCHVKATSASDFVYNARFQREQFVSTAGATVQDTPPQVTRKFQGEIKVPVTLEYLLYLPKEYSDSDKKWPLVLFLHGSGESGADIGKVKVHGPPKHVEAGENYPFVLVSPQAPSARRGWEPAALNALIDDVVASNKIDASRIYVTGLSMGGYGTWALAQAYPDKFAAIMPVCGGGEPAKAASIKHLPIWIFHGRKDQAVPILRSEEMIEALKEAGASGVRVTFYPEAGHDSWTETYSNPEVWKWLLEQSKTPTK